jgi:hypothetical protein
MALGLGLWLFVGLCAAQRVLVARPNAADQVLVESFHRLRAELRLEGFSVEVLQLPGTPSPQQARQVTQEAGAFAAVVLVRTEGDTAVDVWITDRVTGKMVLQTLRLDAVDDAPSVLALRAVDLLRNSLLELRTETPAPEVVGVDRGPVPDEVQQFTESPKLYRLGLGGLLLDAGALGRGWGASVVLQRGIGERLRLGLTFAGPLLGGRWSTELGSVSAHQELLLAEASYDVARLGPLTLAPVLGGGGYHLSASGDVDAPLLGRQDAVLSAALALGAALDVRLSSALVVSGNARALLLAPRPGVEVDTERVLLASPLLTASIAAGVEF